MGPHFINFPSLPRGNMSASVQPAGASIPPKEGIYPFYFGTEYAA